MRSKLACAVVILASARAVTHAAAQDTTNWTIDDILLQESAGQFAFSPDGQWLVWIRSGVDEDEGRIASNVWLTRLTDGASWPLTRGSDSHRAPRWSPDGQLIGFISSRKLPDGDDDADGPQVWLQRLAGGEPWPVTTSVRGLRDFAWKGSSADTIVLLAREREREFERQRKERKDTGIAVEDTLEAGPIRLWVRSVEGGSLRRLTDNTDWIESMSVSHDGRRAVTRHQVSLSWEFDQARPPATYLVDLETGERRRILERGRTYPGSIAWDLEDRGFYFAYEFSTDPRYLTATVTRLAYFDLAADSMIPVDLNWERELGSGYDVVPGGFVAGLADGVRFRWARFERRGAGWQRRMLEGGNVEQVQSVAVSRDGTQIAYVTSSANTPPQPFTARLDGRRIREARQIATLNPSFATKPSPRVEIVRWAGARGEAVEGVLYYPLDYREGRAYPLIVSIHGGPTGVDLDAWSQSWSRPLLLFNQMGAFVFKPNYHGSGNYGLEWVESLGGGNYYALEIPDIERGVDHLIQRGLVHPDSVATHGWSNGAILSTELTTRNPERYKASAAGAGDVEWISDWGNVDFGASFDNYYFGANPLEDPQRYIELSPFFRLGDVRTPTLIFFGTEDRNVPPSQGWSHFRALQQLGTTEVRFILFPGEPHGIRKLAHQRRKVAEEVRWFERHLWGRPDTTNLAVREASPLALLLALEPAARQDGRYGEVVNGLLVPEVVRTAGLDIGRFEITRAQWQAFDPAFRFPAGTDNYPVGDVTFEQAQSYVAWLADRTGQPFRLPRSEELTPLAKGDGVTLEAWTGYSPTPEDLVELERAVTHLSGSAPLLRQVGSVPADAKGTSPHIYDLNGNVAEWTAGGDGGVLVGGSADRPKEAPGTRAAPAYRGLRVVRAP